MMRRARRVGRHHRLGAPEGLEDRLVLSGPDLGIVAVAASANATVGQPVTYTIEVTNSPNADPIPVGIPITVTDLAALGLSNVTPSAASGWSFAISNTTSPSLITATYTGTMPIGPGQSLPPITVTGTANGAVLGLIANTSTASVPGDLDLANDTTTVDVDIANTAVASTLAVAPASGTYGGTADLSATLTSNSAPLAGEPVDFHLGATDLGTVTTNALGVASIPATLGELGAGSYAGDVTASFAGDAGLLASDGSADLNVARAALTITANAESKLYGAAVPLLTATYTGFVNGETLASLTTPTTLATTATAFSHVGSYAITASGASSANYVITYAGGMLSVTPAPLTVTPNNVIKPYGVAVPSLTATYSGFVNGDSPASLATPVTLSTSATTSSTFGSYPITATGGSSSDYTIVRGQGTLTVPTDPAEAAFVTAVYQDVLGRAPEASGLDFWLAEMNNGAGRSTVINLIYNSPEGNSTRSAHSVPTDPTAPAKISLVFALYEDALGRDPEPVGIDFWLSQLDHGLNPVQLSADIYGSSEAVADRSTAPPAPSPTAAVQAFLIDALYEDTLGRDPEPSGVAFWQARLNLGENAAQLAFDIYESPEAVSHRGG